MKESKFIKLPKRIRSTRLKFVLDGKGFPSFLENITFHLQLESFKSEKCHNRRRTCRSAGNRLSKKTKARMTGEEKRSELANVGTNPKVCEEMRCQQKSEANLTKSRLRRGTTGKRAIGVNRWQ